MEETKKRKLEKMVSMLKPPIRAAEKNRIATNDFANDIANISIQKYNNIVHNNSNELNFNHH